MKLKEKKHAFAADTRNVYLLKRVARSLRERVLTLELNATPLTLPPLTLSVSNYAVLHRRDTFNHPSNVKVVPRPLAWSRVIQVRKWSGCRLTTLHMPADSKVKPRLKLPLPGATRLWRPMHKFRFALYCTVLVSLVPFAKIWNILSAFL